MMNKMLSLLGEKVDQIVIGTKRDRLVLKVININDDKLTEELNLRVGKVNLNSSSVDVKWHPMERMFANCIPLYLLRKNIKA
jgi:hypothetical protein